MNTKTRMNDNQLYNTFRRNFKFSLRWRMSMHNVQEVSPLKALNFLKKIQLFF